MPETIAARIARMRDERFMSTPELAQRAGISKGVLYDILAGRSQPQRRTIRRLAEAFDVTPHEVAGAHQTSMVLEPCLSGAGTTPGAV